MKPCIMVVGLPASGKSTIVKPLAAQGYTILNRDALGGTLAGVLKHFTAMVGHVPIVLDNLNLTVEDRRPFIEMAISAGVEIECHWMQTSFEDAQVNALNRMYDRYDQVFLTADDIKQHPQAHKDPNIFPMAAMFSARKRLDGDKKAGVPSGKPTLEEGFSRIVKVPFKRQPYTGTRKALILDYDGTLRRDAKEMGGANHYPTCVEEIEILPNRREVLKRYADEGWLLLGISTQSGIDKGVVTREVVEQCFEATNQMLGQAIEVTYCPHHSFPVSCYCRKPQAGLGIQAIRRHNLNPSQCIFVGDLGTDASFAARCGFQFKSADDFFEG